MAERPNNVPLSSLPPVAPKRRRRQDSCFTWATQEGRDRRIAHLIVLGWKTDGPDWISPHTGTIFTLQTALDVEQLRGRFKQGWFDDL